MKEFLIGCTHFGHENIIRLANRPFSSLVEMDETLIHNWNSIVNKKDTVYHLGDFSFRNVKSNSIYKTRLNGRIVQIQGNHDPKNYGKNLIELNREKVKIVLMHYPIEEWNGYYRDSVHFHCHTHNTEFKSATRRGNVGVDAINFKPIELIQAIERVKS